MKMLVYVSICTNYDTSISGRRSFFLIDHSAQNKKKQKLDAHISEIRSK